MSKLEYETLLGSFLNKIPYSCVPYIGIIYGHSYKDIQRFVNLTTEEKKVFVFRKVFTMVKYAIENIPFYQTYYKEEGFSIAQLKTYDDIKNIPIVRKKDLMAVPLEHRGIFSKMGFIANTGGSTGVPLSFYKTRAQQIKEMAYYHDAWSKLGYTKSDLRLQLVGRTKSQDIGYDITRNRLTAGVYMPFDKLLIQLSLISENNSVSFLQGYPSVLFELALYLEDNPEAFKSSGLKDSLKGVFFNSEYPYPKYRKKIEEILGVKSIVSYGHTEGCVLAFDFGSEDYEVYQSYGYAEIEEIEGENHLIGTSYDNFASPFIRYDTGDVVDNAQCEDGILKSFRMTDGGRTGQYLIDRTGKRISLTGLIFGRHHALLNYCSQIQISQTKPGLATVYYVAKDMNFGSRNPEDLFETDNIEMDFDFKRINSPIRTKAGKVLLLVPPQE